MPVPATPVSIFMELSVVFAVAIGAFTRPAAALMALYSLRTALIGHQCWTAKDANCVDSLEGFYKDLSIVDGFLLLYITGPGKYPVDAMLGIAGASASTQNSSSCRVFPMPDK
jgi:putative oxidoreductase